MIFNENLFYSNSDFFIEHEFSIFRGNFLLIMYLFALGMNVYLWESYNINYKRAFTI